MHNESKLFLATNETDFYVTQLRVTVLLHCAYFFLFHFFTLAYYFYLSTVPWAQCLKQRLIGLELAAKIVCTPYMLMCDSWVFVCNSLAHKFV